MADDIRRRSTCDRCQAHKLRCPKRPEERTCERCRRARTSCIYSPFRQKKTTVTVREDESVIPLVQPKGSAEFFNTSTTKRKRTAISAKRSDVTLDQQITSPIASVPNDVGSINDTDMVPWSPNAPALLEDFDQLFLPKEHGIDFSDANLFLDFHQPMPEVPQWHPSQEFNSYQTPGSVMPQCQYDKDFSSLNEFNNKQYELPSAHAESSEWLFSPKASVPESPASLIRQLSELSIKLYEEGELMPPLSIHDPTPKGDRVRDPKDYSRFSLESVITFTHKLISIYPVFIAALFRSHDAQSSETNISDTQISKGGSASDNNSFISHSSKLDHSAVLLILSCHLRLIGIWEHLLKHMAVCVAQKGIALRPAQKEANLKIPILRIGNFVPPASVAVPMQMLMFSQNLVELHGCASDLTARIQSFEERENFLSPASWKGPAAMSLRAAVDVKRRANGVLEEFRSLRGLATSSGLFAYL